MPKKKQVLTSKKSQDSRLISIRIPEKMIHELRQTADKKGMGYQKLIKSYLAENLEKKNAPSLKLAQPAMRSIARQELRAIGTPVVIKSQPVKKKDSDLFSSKIIGEDIRGLARSLKPFYDDFAGKTFLITGAFGFLGRYMVSLLKYLNEEILEEKAHALLLDNFITGYEQRVISDKNLNFHRHNVIEPFDTPEPIDYIIHAAGIASPAYYTKFPIETMDVGTVGTRNMLDLACRKGVKSFLFTSSSEVYGDPDPKHVPTAEDYYGNVSITGPRSCYDESKRFGETMCLAYWQVYNVPVKMVRPFNVYGPGIRPDDYRVLPNFIEHALRKESLPIHGRGHNTRSFCYIADAIEAIFRVLFSKEHGESFNIGNPSPEISVKDLAELVAKAMPYPVEIRHIDPPHAVYATSDPKRRCPDITKLQERTGFQPKYSLNNGLKRTIQWFQGL